MTVAQGLRLASRFWRRGRCGWVGRGGCRCVAPCRSATVRSSVPGVLSIFAACGICGTSPVWMCRRTRTPGCRRSAGCSTGLMTGWEPLEDRITGMRDDTDALVAHLKPSHAHPRSRDARSPRVDEVLRRVGRQIGHGFLLSVGRSGQLSVAGACHRPTMPSTSPRAVPFQSARGSVMPSAQPRSIAAQVCTSRVRIVMIRSART